MINWTSEKRLLRDLNPAPYNPRQLTQKQTHDLRTSLERFSLADPIIINKNNTVIGGHQRINILKTQGAQNTEVDVRVPDRLLNLKEERELNLRLNKNLGEWNFDELANFDEEMLLDVGFDSKEIDKIFGLNDRPDEDNAPALPATSDIKPGDIWTLGKHRLMCGDATDQGWVKILMDGKEADLIFTDPPYNVDYSGDGEHTQNKIKNDNLSKEDFRNFLIKAFNNYRQFSTKNAPIYCCYASRNHRDFEDALNAAEFKVRNQIIWVKLLASMGWGDYRWKHEPIFYAVKKGSVTEFFGDRKQYTEWTEEKSDEDLLKMVKAMIQKDEAGGSTVWRFSRESDYKHPTQKPVELIKKAIVNSSRRENIVLDLFGGSGSTLIACEALSRTCYTMEIDPRYCQVILERYEQFTGKKAEKVEAVHA